MGKADNELFYKASIKKYGVNHRGVHWISKHNQEIRFKILLSMINDDIDNYTIVDAGCGFGDMFLYMKKNKTVSKRYIGIDALKCMVDIAKQNTDQTIIQSDICIDELPSADFYICSGAMNTLTLFETHQFIQNCYNSSKYGFIFNILYGDKKSDRYNYITDTHIQNIAKALNVKNIQLESGYLDADISVGFFK